MNRFNLILLILLMFAISMRAQEQVVPPPDYVLSSPDEELNGSFGGSVAGIRDINGDGYPDVAIGAAMETPDSGPNGAGCVYVYCGKTGDIIRTLVSPNQEEDGHFGFCVSEGGDVDNDLYPDLIVGAPDEDPGMSPASAGRAYVFNGVTGDLIYTLSSPNEEENGYFGCSVYYVPNSGGNDHPLVGAHGESPGTSPEGAGRAYLINGIDGSVIRTFVSPNEEKNGHFGFSVSSGSYYAFSFFEVIVGAYGESPGASPEEAGRAYVFNCFTGNEMQTFASPYEEQNGRFGYSVVGLGDIDDDCIADYVIGAPNENPYTAPEDAGAAYLLSGQTGTMLRKLQSPNAEENGHFASSMILLGDLSLDSHPDLAIGAPDEDGICTDMGRAYVFSIWNDLFYVMESSNPEPSGHFGHAVSGAFYTGYAPHHVVVGAPFEQGSAGTIDAGKAYTYSFPYVHLTGAYDSGTLTLDWTPCPNSYSYDIYGTSDTVFFEPGLTSPYEYRLDTITGGFTSWTTTLGIGNSDQDYTFLVVGRNMYGDIMGISNRFGENEFNVDIP
jgi:hypothetical protein